MLFRKDRTVPKSIPSKYNIDKKYNSDVVFGKDRFTNQKVVIRRWHAQEEYNALSALRPHPNIPTVLDFWIAEPHDKLEKGMEWFEFHRDRLATTFVGTCDLENIFNRSEYKRNKLKGMMETLFDALYFVHSHGMVHGDLHHQNIRVDEKTLTPYLIDFEFSGMYAAVQCNREGMTYKYEVEKLIYWTHRLVYPGESPYRTDGSLGHQFYWAIDEIEEEDYVQLHAVARQLLYTV